MIALKNIGKKFSGNTVLADITLSVPKSSVFALVGPNGSGKSTLLKILLGLVLPETGKVTYEGFDSTENNRDFRKFIGYMPQIPSFPENLKVKEIINFLDSLNGSHPEHHEELMQEMEISGFYDKTFGNLSGGMKQKVNILQCFRAEKNLYILDEPTVSLDPQMAYYLKQLVKKRRENGASVIFTSHIMHEVEDMADRMVLLSDGRIKLDKTLAELKEISGQSLEETLRKYWSRS